MKIDAPWCMVAISNEQSFRIVSKSTGREIAVPCTVVGFKQAAWYRQTVDADRLWRSVADEKEQVIAELIVQAPQVLNALRLLKIATDGLQAPQAAPDDIDRVLMLDRARACANDVLSTFGDIEA